MLRTKADPETSKVGALRKLFEALEGRQSSIDPGPLLALLKAAAVISVQKEKDLQDPIDAYDILSGDESWPGDCFKFRGRFILDECGCKPEPAAADLAYASTPVVAGPQKVALAKLFPEGPESDAACPQCGQKARSRTVLETLPEVLLLVIGRVVEDGTSSSTKVTVPRELALTARDHERRSYKPIAAVFHEKHPPHFVTAALEGGKWYWYDDSAPRESKTSFAAAVNQPQTRVSSKDRPLGPPSSHPRSQGGPHPVHARVAGRCRRTQADARAGRRSRPVQARGDGRVSR